MWTARVFGFCVCTVCLLDISCAVTEIGYEGEDFTFHVGYPPEYEENSKYFGRSDGFFFDKLVQSAESNRWIRRGRFALLDNTSTHSLTATIFSLISEDSGEYSFGVDVKLLPDPDTQIQLTVRRRGEPQKPTTSSPRVVVISTNSPANITAQNWTETGEQESYLRFVTVLSLVCVGTLLVVCPFALFKVFKWAANCKLSVSVSYHSRMTSDHIVDEYLKMSPVVLSNSSVAQREKGSFVEDFHRLTNTQQSHGKDNDYIDSAPADSLDQIYTEMNPGFAQESIYYSIDQITD